MLIKTIQNGENSHTLLCQECGALCDTVDRDTLHGLLRAGRPIFCFDCDNVTADQIPEVLLSDELVYTLVIDGKTFVINWVAECKAQAKRADFWKIWGNQWLDHLKEVFQRKANER